MSSIGRMLRSLFLILKRNPLIATLLVIVVIAIVGFSVGGAGIDNTEEPVIGGEETQTVSLFVVSSSEQSTLSGGGREVVVRAEAGGKITRVVPVGTFVSVGTTIAELENARERASLLQAEGALEAAQVALRKTEEGPRDERIAVLETVFESAKGSAVTTVLSAYASVDNAIRAVADKMINNPESTRPQLAFSSTNFQRRVDLENARITLNPILSRQRGAESGITTETNFETEFDVTEREVREVRAFIDTLIAALNEAIPTESVSSTQIATFKTDATSARTTLTSVLSSITSARAALLTAEKNLEEGLTGAESTDLAAARAAVKQAQGAYDAAFAAYQKTFVKSATAGTITACSATAGDVISIGADVCRITVAAGSSGDAAFVIPLSSVKYTPSGTFVFVVQSEGVLESLPVTTELVTANGIRVRGLEGSEHIVRDVRGLKEGDSVTITQ